MNYRERMNKLFADAPETAWEHCTLRTVFDPQSDEWSETTINQKFEILQKVVKNGESLLGLFYEYKLHYDESGRKDIAGAAEHGLLELLEHALKITDA